LEEVEIVEEEERLVVEVEPVEVEVGVEEEGEPIP
jgi:hypothetical protein